MRDPLMALSRVKFLEAQFAGEELNEAADKQEETVAKMKDVRAAQEAYDAAVADGEVTETERNALEEALEAAGLEAPSSLTSASGTEDLDAEEDADADEVDEAEENKAAYEAINTQIKNLSDSLED